MPTVSHLLSDHDGWQKNPALYRDLDSQTLARAVVLRHIVAFGQAPLDNIMGSSPAEGVFLSKGSFIPSETRSNQFLGDVLGEVNIHASEIRNAGYSLQARIAPDKILQDSHVLPSGGFAQDAITALTSGRYEDYTVRAAAEIARASHFNQSWSKIAGRSLVLLAALPQHAPAIGAVSLYSALVAKRYETKIPKILEHAEKHLLKPICDQWIAAAGDVTQATIGLKDKGFGYDRLLAGYETDDFADTGMYRRLDGIAEHFREFNVIPQGIEDIRETTPTWRRALIHNAITPHMGQHGNGFIVEIMSPNADLAGTRLQIIASPDASAWKSPGDDDDSGGGGDSNNKKNRDKKGRVRGWGPDLVPSGA